MRDHPMQLDPMQLEERPSTVVVLRLVGDLTRGPSSIAFAQEVKDLIERSVDMIAVDARATGYIESYGLGVIVRCAKECREAGLSFAMIGLNNDLVTLFDLLKLDTVIRVYTEREWLESGGDALS